MNQRRGLMLLDVLIIILAVGVIASLLLPYLRTEREVKLRDICRNRMKMIAEAELKYFETAGGKIEQKSETADTVVNVENAPEDADSTVIRKFTKDIDELKKFLPQGSDTFNFVCPLDGREFIIIARDSFFYSISCPNGHGQVIMGTPTWETQ